jgi:hypothetical protein
LFFSSGIAAQNISKIDSIYTLSLGDLVFKVNANYGGRIISFQRGGRELLLQNDVNPIYFGATLWVSPQKNFWPPSLILDREPYRPEIKNKTLRLTSKNDTISGLRIIKEFSISKKDTSILINYMIRNISNKTQQVAAWEVTRIPGGISTFFIDEMLKSDLKNVVIKDNLLTFTFTPDTTANRQKLFATVKKGYLTHQYNDLLFIKKFPEVSKENLPPSHGAVEIYADPIGLYLELENHGKCTVLKTGEQLHYTQQCLLH